MAAPTLSGHTLLNILNNSTGTVTSSDGDLTGITGNTATGSIRNAATNSSGINFSAAKIAPYWAGRRISLSAPQQAFASNEFISIGVSCTVLSAVVANKADKGIVVVLFSNAGFTEYAEYIIGGGDTPSAQLYAGSWFVPIIQPSTYATTADTYTAGFNPSTITAIECRFSKKATTAATLRINQLVKFSAISLVGGDSTTPGSLQSFYDYLEGSTATAAHYKQGSSQFLFTVPLTIGNGSTATRFEQKNSAFEFVRASAAGNSDNPALVRTEQPKLTINNSASDVVAIEGDLFSCGGKWNLQLAGNTALGSNFTWSGGAVSNLGTNALGGSARFSNVGFFGCDRLIPSASRSFAGCTIANSTDTSGAFTWDGSQNIAGATFSGNSRAIRIATAGTYTLNTNTFSGNTYDFNVTATTGTVTIAVDAATTTDKTWTNSTGAVAANGVFSAGADVTFVLPQPTLTLTGLVAGVEVRIYDLDSATPGELGTELAGIETLVGTTFDYTYTTAKTGDSIWVQVIGTGYREFGQSVVLGSASASFGVVLEEDTNL